MPSNKIDTFDIDSSMGQDFQVIGYNPKLYTKLEPGADLNTIYTPGVYYSPYDHYSDDNTYVGSMKNLPPRYYSQTSMCPCFVLHVIVSDFYDGGNDGYPPGIYTGYQIFTVATGDRDAFMTRTYYRTFYLYEKWDDETDAPFIDPETGDTVDEPHFSEWGNYYMTTDPVIGPIMSPIEIISGYNYNCTAEDAKKFGYIELMKYHNTGLNYSTILDHNGDHKVGIKIDPANDTISNIIDDNEYEIHTTKNRPSGSYSGDGATQRTIQIGGEDTKMLAIYNVFYGSDGNQRVALHIVSPFGDFCMSGIHGTSGTPDIRFFAANAIKYDYGQLSITDISNTDDSINAYANTLGTSYYYVVL